MAIFKITKTTSEAWVVHAISGKRAIEKWQKGEAIQLPEGDFHVGNDSFEVEMLESRIAEYTRARNLLRNAEGKG